MKIAKRLQKRFRNLFTWVYVIAIALPGAASAPVTGVQTSVIPGYQSTQLSADSAVMQVQGQQGPITISSEILNEASLTDVENLISERNQTRDVVVASDDARVIDLGATYIHSADEKNAQGKNIRFMPLGKLTEMTAAARTEFGEYLLRAQNTLRTDKITVVLLTVTTAVDSFVWIQATSLDFPQKLAMLSYNMLMAVTFGLDRELWGKGTAALQSKTLILLDFFGGYANSNITKAKVLASQFTSNFILGSTFFLSRYCLLSFQHLHESLSSQAFWIDSLKLSAAATLTQFAWAELYSSTNGALNPVAKLNLKRISDLRYVVMTFFASSSMVLQPEVYGQTPMVTYIVHGALGLAALLSAEKLISFLESNPISLQIYKHSQTLENALNRISTPQEPLDSVPGLCSALF